MTDYKSIIKSNAFCLVPWIHQMIDTSGAHKLCCVSQGAILKKDDDSDYNSSRNELKDSWNSNHMKSFRKKMLDGIKLDECDSCYSDERVGRTSLRQNINGGWLNSLGEEEIKDRIIYSLQNNYEVLASPVYLDLRLGNLCNLKCRMCHPFSSKQIADEHYSLLKNNPDYNEIYDSMDIAWPNDSSLIQEDYYNDNMNSEWYESNLLWDELIEMIPHLKRVYLTGGEPTLIKNNYKFMEAIIERGYNKKLSLAFNINGMNVNDRFLKLISQFAEIQINVSIDGIGTGNEYIRGNSEWEVVDTNFQKLMSLDNVKEDWHRSPIKLFVNSTIQVYNILDVKNLLDYVTNCRLKFKKYIDLDFILLNNPKFLNVGILNKKIRTKCIDLLDEFLNESSHLYKDDSITLNSVHAVKNLMSEEPTNSHLLKYFMNYTEILDKSRNQTFSNALPELYEMINE
jgi:MoaA/NifB/PqqE/SkfB family radical SAM enzyme